ncbi:hypothetical protein Tco_0080455 [Tanacetum coccineum]
MNALTLPSLIEKEKLNGTNFLDCHRNLRIIVKYEEKLDTIETHLPKSPSAYQYKFDEKKKITLLINLQAGGAHEDIRRSPCKDKYAEDTEDILKCLKDIICSYLFMVSCDDDVGYVNIVEPMLVMVIFKKTTESVIKKEDMAERKVLLGIFTLKQLCKNVNVVTVPFTRVDTYLGSMVLFAFEFQRYQNCPLRFDDKIRFANLFPLEMSDFDISLGMNFGEGVVISCFCVHFSPIAYSLRFGEGVVISCFCVHFSPIAYSLSHGGTMTMSLMHQWHDTICGGVISPRRSLLYGAYGCILELLPPKKRIHSPSSSSTTLSNSSRNQTCDLVSPSSSVYTPTPPQIFEIGKCPIKMYLKHHEGQIEDILNYLDELYLHHIEKMEEGRIDRMIIRRNSDELKTELKKIRTQIIKLQKKQLGQKDKIAFAYYRISDLEQIIEKIQARHQTDQEDL